MALFQRIDPRDIRERRIIQPAHFFVDRKEYVRGNLP
jgi:hypothetical protein